MMHIGTAGGCKHLKLYVSCKGWGPDNIAPWIVYVKNHASDIVSLSEPCHVFLCANRGAGGVQACRHCRTLVLENHREDKAPMTRSDMCSPKFTDLGPVA